MFICNHCPFVKHVRGELARLGSDYQAKGRGDRRHQLQRRRGTYPDDSPEKMADEARTRGYTFPYLYDETQAVAKAYRAACTPDFFLFDRQRKLVYRGQFDDSRPGNGMPVTGATCGPPSTPCSPASRRRPSRSRASAATSSGRRATSRPYFG